MIFERLGFRTDGLSYYLELSEDLTEPSGWTTNGDHWVVGIDPMPSSSDFEAVTNWIPMDGKSAEFVQLVIEKN